MFILLLSNGGRVATVVRIFPTNWEALEDWVRMPMALSLVNLAMLHLTAVPGD